MSESAKLVAFTLQNECQLLQRADIPVRRHDGLGFARSGHPRDAIGAVGRPSASILPDRSSVFAQKSGSQIGLVGLRDVLAEETAIVLGADDNIPPACL